MALYLRPNINNLRFPTMIMIELVWSQKQDSSTSLQSPPAKLLHCCSSIWECRILHAILHRLVRQDSSTVSSHELDLWALDESVE